MYPLGIGVGQGPTLCFGVVVGVGVMLSVDEGVGVTAGLGPVTNLGFGGRRTLCRIRS
jgi:hypothetical protein